MKNFKIILLGLTFLSFIFSCNKDELKNDSPNGIGKLEERTIVPTVINGMLHFDSYSDFISFQETLKNQEQDTNAVKAAYLALGIDTNSDSIPNPTSNPVCLKSEIDLNNFMSARRIEEQQINAVLDNGGYIFTIIDNPYFKSSLNANNSVSIGNRIYKYFNDGSIAIVINNDLTAYNIIKNQNFEDIIEVLNVRLYKSQTIFEPTDSNSLNVVTSNDLIQDIRVKENQLLNGTYSIQNVSAIETANGQLPEFKWEYSDNSSYVGISPDRNLNSGDLIKLTIPNLSSNVIYAKNIAGDCDFAIGPNNIIAKSNCTFDFNANSILFPIGLWDVEWTFSDGTVNKNWTFTKQFKYNLTVKLCYINKATKSKCCGSTVLNSTSCECGGEKRTRSGHFDHTISGGGTWRVEASIWVQSGDVGADVGSLRKNWLGRFVRTNSYLTLDLIGIYKRQLSDKTCEVRYCNSSPITVFANKVTRKRYETTTNLFRDPNMLEALATVKVDNNIFGYGVNGIPKFKLD